MDNTKWHRIVLSVDTTSFFDVYVDGVQFLAGGATGLDGRFSLELDRFNLFADNDWEDSWILCGTVATWGRALSAEEIAPMGGWIGSSATPTPLYIIPEPATMSLLALGGIISVTGIKLLEETDRICRPQRFHQDMNTRFADIIGRS